MIIYDHDQTEYHHKPVLIEKILEIFQLSPGYFIVDGTIGGGGHSSAFLEKIIPGGILLGIDRDLEVLEIAKQNLNSQIVNKINVHFVHGTYDDLPKHLEELGLKNPDRILLDLGCNSMQIDNPLRGMSFRNNGELDGRYNRQEDTPTIKNLVNELSIDELTEIFSKFGQERKAKLIAKLIVEFRNVKKISTTHELADIIRSAFSRKDMVTQKIDVCTRSFQALRIAVNKELEYVERGVRACVESLAEGGIMAVISFHSLEDTIVKSIFDEYAVPAPDPTNPYQATSNVELKYEVTKRKSIKASIEEIGKNPRSRSARMRVIHRKF